MKVFFQCSMVVFLFCSFVLPVFSDQESSKVIHYSDFGAKGDGVNDDFDSIIKAHAAANKDDLSVEADPGATYYIGSAKKTAIIQTNTDWKDAKFIIDDSGVKPGNRPVFFVSSKIPSQQITSIKKLKKNQKKLDLSFPHHSFISVSDKNTLRYIRYGLNQDNGSPQADVFMIDQEGNVNDQTPLIWDFDHISSMILYPIDTKRLSIRGGHFTTIANQAESRYTYYSRGIDITRSNVLVDGVVHAITGEKDHGAPYGGFFFISNCSNVQIRNCKLSGHRIYKTIGSANAPVSMGSYDISVYKSVNITFKNCCQLNDIHDRTLWGIYGSNYTKNILFDHVSFSRFDAHMGVVNVTIRNSELGHQGINLIGSGKFLIENSKVSGTNFIGLRGDYGSTFNGTIVIRQCEFIPRNGIRSDAVLIVGSHSGSHDFGYECFMPRKILIDGLIIQDNNPVKGYKGPKIFGSFNHAYTSEEYKEKFPYRITEEVDIRNLSTKSGLPCFLSSNPFMFRNVQLKTKEADVRR